MSFPQFAFNNVRRNARAYFAYFLSSSFMVMVFFTYALFIFHPDINNTDLGASTRMVMEIMEYIIYIFSFMFVLYSIGSFLKARNKEFGILTILGATQGQLSWLVFVENMIIGAVSIVTGIGAGLILSKLFLLLSAKVIGIANLGLYFPVKALLLTISAFALLFVVISAFTLILIRRNRVLELLKGTSKPKIEPKASILISLLGIVLLGIGYAFLDKKIEVAAVTGIAGTYFFFTQITVLIMRLLKRSRALVWRGTNLIWISEMAYKIKDNARILFMVTVVTSISCMSVAFVLSTDQRNKTVYANNPYAIQYNIYEDQDRAKDLLEVDNTLKKNGVPFEALQTESYVSPIKGVERTYVNVSSASNYNTLAKSLKMHTIDQLGNQQSVMVVSPMSEEVNTGWYHQSEISLKNPDEKLQIKEVLHPKKEISPKGDEFMLIVSDQEYSKLKNSIAKDELYRIQKMVVYNIPQWNKDRIPSSEDQESIIGTNLHQQAFDKRTQSETQNYLTTRSGRFTEMKQSTSMMSFVGIFITAVLSISSASFLYFKLHTELRQDQQMYRSMSKIGLQAKEMNKAATIQIASLFFIPIVVSTIQTLVVLNAVRKDFGLGEVNTSVMMASAAFLVVQMVYFMLVRSRYVQKLKRVMV